MFRVNYPKSQRVGKCYAEEREGVMYLFCYMVYSVLDNYEVEIVEIGILDEQRGIEHKNICSFDNIFLNNGILNP